jgi:hypothetical protein
MDKLLELSKKLHSKYFLPGYYLIELPKDFNCELQFNSIYHSYLQGYIYESNFFITVLGIPLEVVIHKPIKPVHRCEFEDWFGFGQHCQYYDPNKRKICCPKYPRKQIDELLSKINISAGTTNTGTTICAGSNTNTDTCASSNTDTDTHAGSNANTSTDTSACTDTITEDTIKDLCVLMILGGYWNRNEAVTELLSFSTLKFGVREIQFSEIFDYLFDKLKENVNRG